MKTFSKNSKNSVLCTDSQYARNEDIRILSSITALNAGALKLDLLPTEPPFDLSKSEYENLSNKYLLTRQRFWTSSRRSFFFFFEACLKPTKNNPHKIKNRLTWQGLDLRHCRFCRRDKVFLRQFCFDGGHIWRIIVVVASLSLWTWSVQFRHGKARIHIVNGRRIVIIVLHPRKHSSTTNARKGNTVQFCCDINHERNNQANLESVEVSSSSSTLSLSSLSRRRSKFSSLCKSLSNSARGLGVGFFDMRRWGVLLFRNTRYWG